MKIPKFAPIRLEGSLESIDRKLRAQGEKLKPFRYDGPTGKNGKWELMEFTVEEGVGYLRLVRDGGRGMAPGKYHRLVRWEDRKPEFMEKYYEGKGVPTIVMSDTDAEIIDFLDQMRDVHGRVLVGGLGMGLAIKAMVLTGAVSHITIVEIDVELISLVGKYVREMCDKAKVSLDIRQADIFDWTPGKGERWEWGWFDIWDDIATANLPEMAKLRKRYRSRVTTSRFWCEKQCEYMKMGIDERQWPYLNVSR